MIISGQHATQLVYPLCLIKADKSLNSFAMLKKKYACCLLEIKGLGSQNTDS
ncbi:rCG63595 [Rattus norvegicus]|uniref:RCG63595 n=1 Tax=Rattus norvegicus TaxID=10116 RepID=A6J859_RAT|nr:rCG63595 [Rattus norvegicus]